MIQLFQAILPAYVVCCVDLNVYFTGCLASGMYDNTKESALQSDAVSSKKLEKGSVLRVFFCVEPNQQEM